MAPANTQHSGIDLSFVDESVRPQDDLFRHVNGVWLREHEIPADRSIDNTFQKLRDLSEERVRGIIEDCARQRDSSNANVAKIRDLYHSFMDEASIEASGISPLTDTFAAIRTTSNITEFVQVLGQLSREGLADLFHLYVTSDKGDARNNIAYVNQGGLGLPDESFYKSENYTDVRAAYVTHIATMFELAGIDRADERAASVMALETVIAEHHWTNVASRDAEATYNRHTLQSFCELWPDFDFETWRVASGVPLEGLEEIVVRQPSFFTGISALLNTTDLDTWQSWAIYHAVTSMAPYLSRAFVQQNFDFYSHTLAGTPQLRDRWKRGVALVEASLGEAVGEIYVAQYFDASAKARMDELVANLIAAYHHHISNLDWMTSETKVRALEKLSKFTCKIGFPEKWEDYRTLTIVPDDVVTNIRAVTAFERGTMFAKLGAPVDRTEWFVTPQTVNAYYMPTFNEIVFPAAILQPPFFDPLADDAANYGGIGAVIGHEIGHGFDDQGSKYDGDGNLQNWWTDDDRTAFEARTSKLIAQYDALVPTGLENVHVNGSLTIGENIGDLGGLTIAETAYRMSLGGVEPPVVDGLTGLQRFFCGWAQVWRGKSRPELALQRLTTDPHSPNEFRCNQIVKNVHSFYEAFNVQAGDGEYLSPEDRVSIW